MPKITFSSDNKVKQFNDYPKLRFEQKGERARVVCLEAEPLFEFVHSLRAPSIVNGEVVMETIKDKDGNSTQKPKMDFVGQHICFGNVNVLMEKAQKGQPPVDPDNCPTCAAANETEAVEAPRRRMAIHIVRYKTQPGSFKPQEPFQAELLAWVFGEKVFDILASIAEEHGDLRQRDLLLECSNKMFQNVEVQVGGSAAWLSSDETKKFVQRLYAENKSEDLTPLLGRKVTRQQAEEDIAKVRLRHAQAFGGTNEGAGRAPSASEASAVVGLDEILSGPSETVSSKPSTDDDLDLTGLGAGAPDTPAAEPVDSLPEEPAAAPEPSGGDEAEQKKGDVLDFDTLLQGL